MNIFEVLSKELNITLSQVEAAAGLLDEGNTVPFISRYRKEVTGGMDDEVLRQFEQRLAYLRAFEKRREEIRAAIEEQGKLTDEIVAMLENAKILSELEDIYRPYRPKRRTRAGVAKEKGLEPLANWILEQNDGDPTAQAQEYLNEQVETAEEALAGANDIIAELISDTPQTRALLRALALGEGVIASCAAKDEDSTYRMYYEFSEPVKRIAGHRVLALDRGEKEEFLKVSLVLDEERAQKILLDAFVKKNNACGALVKAAAQDAYSRLIFPSIEREIRATLTERAADGAIRVFGANLKSLLMQPPIKGMTVMGLDPAYRTGCKIAVVDATGAVLDTTVVYPTPPQKRIEEAERKLLALIQKYGVNVISIGNGTASRESEQFVADMIKNNKLDVHYVIVNEAGASVYSASKLGAEEFPDFDVTQRSAVSIARRLQDPLAELVKIEPKAIGVGQYQHDMPQNKLGETLTGVVVDCVNAVGVDLNTASAPLLSRVAGVNAGVAKNIVAYREENGEFKDRKSLLKVPKLGKKVFEQAAGFLHVPESENILDRTFVHPESYGAAQALLTVCGYQKSDLKKGGFDDLKARAQGKGIAAIAKEIGVGEPTLRDIIDELVKPGRDPREDLPAPVLRSDVLEMKDLKEGMELTGTVRNCVDFGAFVDIGVHQDGLVHISQITNKFIKHPLEVLKVGDVVKVKVLGVDEKKNRISLTMKL